MSRKKEPVLDLNKVIESYANESGFNKDFVVECVKQSIIKAYVKIFFGIKDYTGAIFDVELSDKKGTTIKYGRVVTNPDDIEDDLLQIDSDDEDVLAAGLKEGDIFYSNESFEDLEKEDLGKYHAFNNAWVNILGQTLSSAQKQALLERYKDKIGDLVDARVEKYNAEKHSYQISIARTMSKLDKRDLIGNETFHEGDIIKVYLQSIDTGKGGSQGATLKVSRSCPEFLMRVFEQNVTEIYDGTVIIKKIVREAGLRSKIAVYSKDPNVDPKGACIGTNGVRVQQIAQTYLGNSPEKEKIDIINYSDNLYKFIVEATSSAYVTGVGIEQNGEQTIANVIVKNGEQQTCIGKKGVNARLTSKLTGVKIQIYQQDEAYLQHIDFKSVSEIYAMDDNPTTPVIAVEEKPVIDEEILPFAQAEAFDTEENNAQEQFVLNEQPVLEETAEEVEEVKPVVQEKPVEKVNVNVTTSIYDLERQIDEENEKQAKASAKKAYKKPKKEEKKNDEDKPNVQKGMDIYTDEELAAMENEEDLDYSYDDSEEYDDYDNDSFYED